MTKDFEKLVNEIMAECEKDGEPVTRKEAEDMARIEMKANSNRRYEQNTSKTRKKTEKVRKVDTEKGKILTDTKVLLEDMGANIINMKTETEIEFTFNNNHYTMKLTKHRPKK